MTRRRSAREPVVPEKEGLRRWARRVVVALAVVVSSWWVFDGGRALILGAYVTPQRGPYEGRLGPWADLVESLGIDPHAVGLKLFFVVVGAVWFVTALAYVLRPWLWRWLILFAVLSLWYLPVGTVAGLVQLALLVWLHPVTEAQGRRRLAERRKERAPPSREDE
ncbi:MAG: hypothetical protein KY455_03800 [Euryarchaeota archaeon]|nr:hypothetical protein [Euryarchaeota archaeon]